MTSPVRALDRYLDDPMAFRREQLILDAEGTRFGEVIEVWQVEDIFRPMDRTQADGRYRYRLCYFELPRGHGKTTSIAGEGVTQLVFAPPDWRGHIAAGDKDQARELFDAAVAFIRRNPALDPAFTIQRDRIVANATGATLRVHSADAPTAHGLIVDWFAIDEFWVQQNRHLFDALYTAAVKRPNWRGVIITTAGFDKKSICWEVRELARSRDDFYAFIAPGRLASWITDEEVERMRETLPAHIFQRFVENKWAEGAGSFITRTALERCIDDRLMPQAHGMSSARYYLGVDLGLTKDRTAAAIVHRVDAKDAEASARAHLPQDQSGFVVLDDLMVWEGDRRNPVRIADVEDWINAAAQRFRLRRIVMDPWQAQATRQRFGGRIEEFRFSAASIAKLSSTLYRLIQSAALRLYPDEDLIDELAQLQAVQTSYGWRIDHQAGKHDDRAIALGMAATIAMERGKSSKPTRITKAVMGGSPGAPAAQARVGNRIIYVDRDGQLAWRPAGDPSARTRKEV